VGAVEVTSNFGAALSRPTVGRPGRPWEAQYIPNLIFDFSKIQNMIGCYFHNGGALESREGPSTTRTALLRREGDSRGGQRPPLPEVNGVAVLPQKRRY